MAPPVSKHLQCAYCPKRFGRHEHLKRHELIHGNAWQFSCKTCGKGFQRRDALSRHEQTHQASGPSLLSKGARACSSCATAKTRCTGQSPCSRCQQKDLQCVYPELAVEEGPNSRGVGQDDQANHSCGPIDANVNIHPEAFASLPPEIPMPFGSSAFDSDFWDPNILSTTNWLDTVINDDFTELQLDFDIINGPSNGVTAPTNTLEAPTSWTSTYTAGIRGPGPVQSPAGPASNRSAQSGVSTETAADICAAQEITSHSVGEYYVDGEPARLPRTKRRKLSSNQPTVTSHASPTSGFSLHPIQIPEDDLQHRIHIPDAIYEQFDHAWQLTSLHRPLSWPAFEASSLPSKEVFELLLGFYFAHFQQTLPLIHPASFAVQETHWLLLFAMAGIGAHFLEEGDRLFAISLSEVVRRTLTWQMEDVSQTSPDPLTLTQIQLLVAVSMAFSGDARLTPHATEMLHQLSSSFTDLVEDSAISNEHETESTDVAWKRWIGEEQRNRTAYSIWLLDCMLSYQFQRRSTLLLSDAEMPLPCNEKQWRAAKAEEWQAVSSTLTPSPSLKDALQELYIDKRLPKDRGEFARIIMIHGLFQRTWEVERYLSNPLSHWEPTANKQSSTEVLPQEPVSLLSLPTYTKWQNSVCDCLDILHWQANATIGQASGLEHPTVVFLHLSRVVLLSPINTIVRYAKSIVGQHRASPSNIATDMRAIQRWASQGQYKARLAAIHAGVVFWHIRRYSIDAFYEAPSVALASLMLWAFGTFAPRPASKHNSKRTNGQTADIHQNGDSSDSAPEGSDDSACGIILLDRPADDELVQQFIRRGHTMRAHITGVGDLYGSQGPQRVLLQGCKLLRSLKCWGINETWLDVLQQFHRSCVTTSERQ